MVIMSIINFVVVLLYFVENLDYKENFKKEVRRLRRRKLLKLVFNATKLRKFSKYLNWKSSSNVGLHFLPLKVLTSILNSYSGWPHLLKSPKIRL